MLDIALSLIALGGGLLRDATRLGWAQGAVPPADYLLRPSPTVIICAHVVGALVLLGRRRWPVVIAIVLAALSVLVPLLSAVFASYAVARYGGRAAAVIGVNVVLLLAILLGGNLITQIGSTNWRAGDPYTLILAVAALTALGLYFRARHDLMIALGERAERAEREANALAEAARLRERAELAVRLHDDVTAQLTVVTMASGALALDGPDPQTRLEAEQVRTAGVRALRSLHVLISTLAGTADAPDRSASIEPGASHTAVRRQLVLDTVSEALLNADKHAPDAWVRVEASEPRSSDEPIEVAVTNGPSRRAAGGWGSGMGLASLGGRAASLGGRLDFGRSEDGGWRTALTLPAPAIASVAERSAERTRDVL